MIFLLPTACTVDLEGRDPWPCSSDQDCNALNVCLRSAEGRFCSPPLPRCAGANCGVDEPGIIVGGGLIDPDASVPELDAAVDAEPPKEVDSGPAPDGATPPDANFLREPDAAPPPPADCPTRASDPDALPTLTRGHLCDRDEDLCVYEFASSELASCDDLCALFELPCVVAGYNPTLFWCGGHDPTIDFGCSDTDVRGMVCGCRI